MAGLKALWRRLQHNLLVHNILSLYGLQAGSYILPLLTIPYFARILGPIGWGLIAFAQSFGAYLGIAIEYGFNLSATRAVSIDREHPERLGRLLGAVTGAKVLLCCVAFGVTVAAETYVRIFRGHPALLWASFAVATFQGLSLTWFFQGIERLRFIAIVDISTRVLGTILALFLVHAERDAWLIVACQAVAALVSLAVMIVASATIIRWRPPTLRGMLEELRHGSSMCLFRATVTLYTTGNGFVLGLFASPASVGYYSGAEKITRALLGMVQPISQATFPRISYLVNHSMERAARLTWLSMFAMVGLALIMCCGAIIAAPLLVHLLLGRHFAPAVPVLRLLALMIPLVAASNVLGIQWMLALKMDRAFNSIIMSCGVGNLALACILARHFHEIGMAVCVVVAEGAVTAAMWVVLRRKRMDPLRFLGPLAFQGLVRSARSVMRSA